MKGIEVETPASLDLTRAAAFAIRIVAIAVLVWAIRWWGYEPCSVCGYHCPAGGLWCA